MYCYVSKICYQLHEIKDEHRDTESSVLETYILILTHKTLSRQIDIYFLGRTLRIIGADIQSSHSTSRYAECLKSDGHTSKNKFLRMKEKIPLK